MKSSGTATAIELTEPTYNSSKKQLIRDNLIESALKIWVYCLTCKMRCLKMWLSCWKWTAGRQLIASWSNRRYSNGVIHHIINPPVALSFSATSQAYKTRLRKHKAGTIKTPCQRSQAFRKLLKSLTQILEEKESKNFSSLWMNYKFKCLTNR